MKIKSIIKGVSVYLGIVKLGNIIGYDETLVVFSVMKGYGSLGCHL